MKKIISFAIVVSSFILFFGSPVKASDVDNPQIYTPEDFEKIMKEASENEDYNEYDNISGDFKRQKFKLDSATIWVGSKYIVDISEKTKVKIKNKKIVKVKKKKDRLVFTGKKVGKTKVTIQTKDTDYYFYLKVIKAPKPKRKVIFS